MIPSSVIDYAQPDSPALFSGDYPIMPGKASSLHHLALVVLLASTLQTRRNTYFVRCQTVPRKYIKHELFSNINEPLTYYPL